MPYSRLAAALAATATIALFAACGSDGDGDSVLLSPTPSAPRPSATTSVCAGSIGSSIQPLTTGPITKERLEAAAQKMREVQQTAAAGDDASARAAFSGDTHAVTHDIDRPLRAADPVLARDLCESILAIELEFRGAGDLKAVAAEAGVSAQLLEDSGRALGVTE